MSNSRFEVLDQLDQDYVAEFLDVEEFKSRMQNISNPFQASNSTGLVHEQVEPSGIEKGLKVAPKVTTQKLVKPKGVKNGRRIWGSYYK